MLHPIVHDNRSHLWCGPAAIALVTGQPTSVIHRLAHEWRRSNGQRKAVQGMCEDELAFIMGRLGFEHADRDQPVIMAGPLVQCLAFAQDLPAIAATHSHWFVVWRGQYADNNTRGPVPAAPDNIADTRVWTLDTWRKVRQPVLPAAKPLPPSRDPLMRAAQRIAGEFRIGIIRPYGCDWWKVVLPDEVDPVDDVLEGEWEAATPAELLRKVETYRDLVEHVREHGELC